MSIEKITSKIIAGGEEARKETLDAARLQCDTILSEAKKKAEKLLADNRARAAEEKSKLISRGKSVAGIDCRKVLLGRKQELIERCFDRAADALVAMKEDEYLKLMVGLGKSSGVTAGELVFNAGERTAIGKKVVDALNKEVKGGKFTLSEKTGDMKGGYIISDGLSFVSNTVEAVVEQFRGELTGEVAKILFPEAKSSEK